MTAEAIKFRTAKVNLVDRKDFDFVNDYGDPIATFTLCYIDRKNKRINTLFETYNRRNASNGRSNASNEALVRLFVEAGVLDWVMTDLDGSDIPYSIDAGVEFFSIEDNAEIFGVVVEFCQTRSNFLQAKDVAGNS
jgi:hypothetical protein